ncbi:MAG TPA: nucleotidyltransferase domain-containing protein [Methanomicrobia archaeon]|nr:nucleotidyltransferase domain-containing protein [Methanomicrobia archaeon]
MREEQLKELKKTLIAVVKQHEVKQAALFGSFARGEATADSRRIATGSPNAVKRQVDVLTYLKDRILREQVMLL